jgi:hypothetical protein
LLRLSLKQEIEFDDFGLDMHARLSELGANGHSSSVKFKLGNKPGYAVVNLFKNSGNHAALRH